MKKTKKNVSKETESSSVKSLFPTGFKYVCRGIRKNNKRRK